MKTWYGGNCQKCKGINEPYMIQFALWKKVAKKQNGFMCISCVESKLKRKLTIEDFIDAPINRGIFGFDAETYIKYGKNYLNFLKNQVKNNRL
jgi:hypothetical protein